MKKIYLCNNRSYLITVIFCMLPILAIGQEAGFEIRNIRENITSIQTKYKDLNGNYAARIRFAVTDSLFEFDTNLGMLAIEKKAGEVSLFVPFEAKRITVRHPKLGIIRDFSLPKLQPRVTYDVEIFVPGYKTPEFYIYAGFGFNAISVMGPLAFLGASYKNFQLEAGYVLGLDKVESITFTRPNDPSFVESYDYSCSKFWVRLGYSMGSETFRVSPQVGVSFNMISGKDASGVSNSGDFFKKSNPMSAFVALRLNLKVVNRLRVYLTPQYDFAIGGDKVFEVIKKGDSKLKAWGEGFGINAGFIYEF